MWAAELLGMWVDKKPMDRCQHEDKNNTCLGKVDDEAASSGGANGVMFHSF